MTSTSDAAPRQFTCRDHKHPKTPYVVDRDLDGDGAVDQLDVSDASRGENRIRTISFQSSRAGRTYVLSEDIVHRELVILIATPPELVADPIARGIIEGALFDRMCDGPDPSLAHYLLDEGIHWFDGPPRVPRDYAMFTTDTTPLMRRHPPPSVSPAGLWIVHRAQFHHHGWAERGVAKLRILAQRGNRVLIGTRQGVVLTNPRRSRHAWIFAFGTVPSHGTRIRGAKIVGDTAVIRTDGGGGDADDDALLHIDLTTGALDWR